MLLVLSVKQRVPKSIRALKTNRTGEWDTTHCIFIYDSYSDSSCSGFLCLKQWGHIYLDELDTLDDVETEVVVTGTMKGEKTSILIINKISNILY